MKFKADMEIVVDVPDFENATETFNAARQFIDERKDEAIGYKLGKNSYKSRKAEKVVLKSIQEVEGE